MSSPLDRDFGPDEPSPYAPKWVRDAADARRGRNSEPPATVAKPPEDPDVEDLPQDLDEEELPRPYAPAAQANEPVLVDRYRLPPSLEPTLMSEPWPVPRTRSGLGLLVRFGVAAAIAAAVALVVVGKVSTPWVVTAKSEKQDSPSFGSRFSGQNAQAAEQPKAASAQLVAAQESPRAPQAIPPAAVPAAGPVEAAAPVQAPANVAAVQPQGNAAPPAVNPTPQPPVGAASQTPAKPTRSFPIRQLERDEVADLMRRGEAFIATGDLASARLVLQRAAEAGDPRAALTLAGTYDPIVLERLGIQGFASDIAKARVWYERAKEFGSSEAMRRLETLASRAQ